MISHGVRNRLAFWALAGLALFLAHDAVFLAQMGPGKALVAELRTAGHEYWSWRASCSSLQRSSPAPRSGSTCGASDGEPRRSPRPPAPTGPFARRFASSWWRLAALVAVAFAVQENVEHLIAHGHAPLGGALLGSEYPLALPVIGMITAIAAGLVALVARTENALVVAIEAALRRRDSRITLRDPPSGKAAVPHRFGPRTTRGRPRTSRSGRRLDPSERTRATRSRDARPGRKPMIRRIGRAAVLGAALAALTAGTALAHEEREVGDYSFVVGFIDEPVFAGQKSGLEFFVSRGEEPVEGLEETLEAEVIFGSQTRDARDQPSVRRGGRVRVGLLPDRRRSVHLPDLRRGRGRAR